MSMSEWKLHRKGIQIKNLANSSEKGMQIDLLKIEPNWQDKGHYHGDFEWVYVLKGSIEDEKGVHKKGDFFVNEKDAFHKPSSKEGCLLLITWSGNVRLEDSEELSAQTLANIKKSEADIKSGKVKTLAEVEARLRR